ncbi:cell wall binding repeat-containing protein [Clostridium sp. DL-VIII]|uniref:N-acetylmuramoyl-L-alanine amidase family protein n=1 Tax=Clostridium sp. DL-VIII TaxID=641107 RepID=UPI00023AFD1F|nr:N-acetylmuramoyl-L-alanine amidase family protein [Clostridium sp. DL-VIII]EHI98353.1 cell wall binding repeat-containing protein [Clostridium sp. DL-VIII]
MRNLKLKTLLIIMAATLSASVVIIPTKASAAWIQTDSGNWNYSNENSLVSGWKSIDGQWYFFDSNENMKTGWLNNEGTWYYLSTSGEMKIGWINDGGTWYYTNSSGAMQTGWLLYNGSWYYLNPSGTMQTGLANVNGKTYYLSESGAMKTGDITVNGINYTFAATGEKISSSAVNTTATASTGTTASASSSSSTSGTSDGSSSGSSGGSSGGSGSSNSSSYSKSLYGTWNVSSIITPKLKNAVSNEKKDALVGLAVGQEFTINSSGITVNGFGDVDNSSIREGIMTSSTFYSKYGNAFKELGIYGDQAKYISSNITINYNSQNHNIPVTVLIVDDGNVYALVDNYALYKLAKQ